MEQANKSSNNDKKKDEYRGNFTKLLNKYSQFEGEL